MLVFLLRLWKNQTCDLPSPPSSTCPPTPHPRRLLVSLFLLLPTFTPSTTPDARCQDPRAWPSASPSVQRGGWRNQPWQACAAQTVCGFNILLRKLQVSWTLYREPLPCTEHFNSMLSHTLPPISYLRFSKPVLIPLQQQSKLRITGTGGPSLRFPGSSPRSQTSK